MASLTGNLVAETYKALLKTIDNDILTASEKQITDGLGGGSNVFIDSQGFLRANKYKVTNGLATQFLKADGSLDSNAYLTSITGVQVITALGYTPVTNQRTLTINGVGYNLSADRSWTVEGTAAVWGNITGTLSNQTDLQAALNAKYNNPTGTISQYIRGDGSIANFPAVTGFVPYTGATANVDLGEYALSAEYLAIDTDTTHVTDVGEIVWNAIDGTFDMGLLNGVVLQAGQELHFYGKAQGAIGNGQAVMFAGVQGDHLLMSLADAATINANPQYFIGIATQDFANNEFGYVTVLGKVRGLNTTSYSLGDVLYYNSTSATDGLLTSTMPVAPNAKIEVAAVVRVHATQGILMVRPHIMPKLNQVQDVYIADPANNHGLFYDLAAGYWRNTSIATALGYTPQAQLSGTGFVKASGTTISYDNSTYLTTADATSTYQRLDRMAINLLASDIQYPNNNAVIAALALKANAANPVFTGNMTISGAEPKLFFTDTDNNPDYTVFIDSGVFYIYDQTAGTTRFSISSTGNISAGVGKSITADSFIKDGGTASQFLKADGSIDSNTYVASSALANYLLISTAASTYQRLDNMAINLLASDTQYPNNNAVIAALALKANAANPVFTGNMSISGAEPKLFFVDTDNNPDYTVFIDSGNFYIYDQTVGSTRFQINSSGNISTGVGKSITAGSFVRDGGTASQFLKADGTIDSSAYITSSALGAYLPLAGGTMSGTPVFSSAFGVGSGDRTNSTTPTYLVSPVSSYWRIVNLSLDGIVSGVYNYQTGKNVYWGEVSDTGSYVFRGRKIEVTSGSDQPLVLNGTNNQYLYIASAADRESMTQYYNATAGNWYTGIRVSAGLGTTSSYHIYSSTFGADVFVLNTDGSATFVNNLSAGKISSVASGTDGGEIKLTNSGGGNTWYWAARTTGLNLGQLAVADARIFVANSGNVLLGTTTDAGFRFDVNGTGRFSAKLNATKTAKNTYGFEIKGAFYGSPRLQLYDLAVDSNGFCGLGVDMSGGAYEMSNYFPRYNGNGRWSVGSWAGDFGTGQYVAGYNEKFYIEETLASFVVPLRVNNLFRTGGITNIVNWAGYTQSATFNTLIADTSATASRTAYFRGTGTGASVWWGRTDANGANVPNAALDSNDGSLGFWVNGGGTGGGSWTNIFNMTTSGITMATGSLIGNVSGTLNGYNTIIAYSGNNVRGRILVADPDSGNISTQNPETYSGEVRLGAAWARGGIYASNTLTMATSSAQMDFVFGNVVKASLRSDTGLIIGSFTGGNYNENLRLVDSSGNFSVIAFGATGTSGAGRFNFLKNPQDNFELRNGSGNTIYSIEQGGPMTYNSNMGVGVTPGCRLHVQAPTVSYGQFRILNSDSSGEASMNIGRTNQGIDARWTIGQGTAGIGDSFGMYSNGANRFTLTTGGIASFQSYVNAAYYLETSDKRLKTLIENNPFIDGIEKLEAKLYEKDGKIELGYFAQDAELIMPYSVQKNDEGFLNLSYREIHTAKIARLEKEVAELKAQLNLN